MVAGVVGVVVARRLLSTYSLLAGKSSDVAELVERGLKYHQQTNMSDAIETFQGAIALCG